MESDENTHFLPLIGESESNAAHIARLVTNSMLEMDLFQIGSFKNASGNVLDLFYTNMPELTCLDRPDILIIPDCKSDKSHTQTLFTIECQPKTFLPNASESTHFCFKKADYQAINNELQAIDFESLLKNDDLNEIVNEFYSIIHRIFDELVPRSSIKYTKKPVWFNSQLSKLKNIRNREYRKLRKKRVVDPDSDTSDFVQAKNQFDDLNKQRYGEYIKGVADNNKNEPSILWQYVNGRRKASVFPTKLEYDNITATNDADKAKLFATFFSSVYVDYGEDSEILNYINNRNDHGCFSINITTNMVKSTLESMELNKGAGPDCIPPLFLRNCAETLAEPLSAIFAKSISKSIYPDRWKTCHIVPIHKSGAKSNVSNYRGVSIMPTVAKVFEKIINYQLRLAVSSQLSKSQHGFLSSRNIETNLMELSIHAHEAFKNNGQIDVFYADIQKAFDSVNQSLLIRKISYKQRHTALVHLILHGTQTNSSCECIVFGAI